MEKHKPETDGNKARVNRLTTLVLAAAPEAFENPANSRALRLAFKNILETYALSPDAARENSILLEKAPELYAALSHAARVTGFPDNGIPAIAAANNKAIAERKAAGKESVNVGIGQGADAKGNVLTNAEISAIFDDLKPDDVSDADWEKVRNIVFGYTAGMGAPWYRALAWNRAQEDCDGFLELAFDPVFMPGGTAVLDKATDMYLNPGEIFLVPGHRWGNVNLQVKKKGAEITEYDVYNPVGSLQQQLETAGESGERKIHIYLNYANNPTGKLPTEDEALELNEVIHAAAKKYDLNIILYVDIPYHPFNYNDEKIDQPLYYYLQPHDKRVIVNASVNGTKRDGMYGLRAADWITILSHDTAAEGKQVLEKGKIAAMIRADLSFSNCLAQYILTRAMTGDALAPLRDPRSLTISEKFKAKEKEMIEWAKECALRMKKDLGDINIELLEGDGGFFIAFHPPRGMWVSELHEALKAEGVMGIPLAKYVWMRFTTTVPKEKYAFFIEAVKKVLAQYEKKDEVKPKGE